MNTEPDKGPEDLPIETGEALGGSTAAHAATPRERRGRVKALDRIDFLVTKVLAGICLVLFIALVTIVTWQVFTRQVLHNSAPWTEEAARYTFVVLAIFAAAYVFSERGHIAVEMLVEKFAPRGQKAMVVLIEATVIFFMGSVFVLGGWLVSRNAWNQDIATLPLSVGQVYVVMPIAGSIIIFYGLARVFRVLVDAEQPFPIGDEFEEAI